MLAELNSLLALKAGDAATADKLWKAFQMIDATFTADFLAASHAVWGQGDSHGVAAAIKAFHEAIATAPRG